MDGVFNSPKTIGVILMGGTGSRYGGNLPKQYVKVKGIELFMHVAKDFENNPLIDEVVFVASLDYFPLIGEILAREKYTKKYTYALSGATREESAYNAVTMLSEKEDKNTIVLITDADRPRSGRCINEIVEKVKVGGVAVAACQVTDSLAISEDGEHITQYQDRSKSVLLQTPQGAKLWILKKAMDKAGESLSRFTDEGSIVLEMLQFAPLIAKTSSLNYKINTVEDMKRFEEETL
ncbi:MAG: 2-C-methyl-D-erythritol 4-phosphate cytidylyltransferase [Bacilli bacterium]|nr:2-C-methyl-D-erythritol 4-phosphate cytidylyltransferase [Bacilli bacterium]